MLIWIILINIVPVETVLIKLILIGPWIILIGIIQIWIVLS